MKKIYARQISPEWQESPLFYDEFFPDNIILDGNHDFKSYTTPEYDQIINYFEDMADDWKNEYYTTVSDCLDNYNFQRNDRKPWNNQQKHDWKELMEGYSSYNIDIDSVIIKALDLITGGDWRERYSRGCCQSDWQKCYFDATKWTHDSLYEFDVELWNTGTEWIIHDENNDPENPEDINGFSVYCTAWNKDGVKEQIADAAGGNAADVILYAFDGYTKTPIYKEV